MPGKSLETLGLPAETTGRVRQLGIDTLDGLQGLVDASPDDLERYVGTAGMHAILRALTGTRSAAAGSTPFEPARAKLGARLGIPPVLPASDAIAERDALFARLQHLEAAGRSAHDQERVELEARLHALLDRDGQA